MAPCLSKFPELCLEAIFSHVPLVDLLRSIGLVCTIWYKSRRTELNKRRRLVLNVGGEHVYDHYRLDCSYGTDLMQYVRREDGSPWIVLESPDQIEFNSLAVPDDRKQAITFFASLRSSFTNITQLFLLHDCTNQTLTEMIRLVDHFSEHLVKLNLNITFSDQNIGIFQNDNALDIDAFDPTTQELVHNLFASLNRLQSIRHLKLGIIIGNLYIPPEPLSCLARLTTFAIWAFGNRLDDWLFASLNQFGQNVLSIEIDNTDIVSMLRVDHQLSSKFTVLSVSCDNDDEPAAQLYDQMRQFCTRFRCLTKLTLGHSFQTLPVTMWARYLSLLPQLVHLDLQFDNIPPVEGEADDDAEDEEMEEEKEEMEVEVEGANEEYENEQGEQVQPEITQVLSVRLLTLTFTANSHHHTERLFIPEIFPNLQVLDLDDGFSQCQDCEIDPLIDGGYYRIHNTEPELARRIAECTRLARRPFRRCANLHTVSLGLNQFFGKKMINPDEL